MKKCPDGLVTNILDCDITVSKFEPMKIDMPLIEEISTGKNGNERQNIC